MRDVKSILCLAAIPIFAIVSMPTSGRDAVAQQEAGPKEAQGTQVIEVIKGSRVERVVVRSDPSIPAGEAPAVAGADELTRQIEVFKGGEVVVLTVVDREPNAPIAERIDAVKSNPGGPTSLLPIRLPAAGAVRPGGPTSLLPAQPRPVEAAVRGGPANLLPDQPGAKRAALQEAATSPIPAQSSVAGAMLRDRPGGGVVVASVGDDSPAWRDGLRQADVIETVYRTPVRTMAELEKELASAGNTAVLQVRRSGREIILVLRR